MAALLPGGTIQNPRGGGTMIRAAVAVAFVGVGVLSGHGFAPAQSAPAFEVASIKPSDPKALNAFSGARGAAWSAGNFTLFMLVQLAYPEYSDPNRIVGGPG